MAEERLPRIPPRHPNTGPVQVDPMPDQPHPPIKPGPKQEEEIKRRERDKEAKEHRN
jgi:hypothetical protein